MTTAVGVVRKPCPVSEGWRWCPASLRCAVVEVRTEAGAGAKFSGGSCADAAATVTAA